MASPKSAVQFLANQCAKGASANIQLAALPEKGTHENLIKTAEIFGAPEIYPGTGNVLSISHEMFHRVSDSIRILLEKCVESGAEVYSGIHTVIVFPRRTPEIIRSQIIETETLLGALKEVTDPLLDQHLFGDGKD